MAKIHVIKGDITKDKYSAVVNGANRDLVSGGGIFEAIHKAAGPELLKECKGLGGCEMGEAKITKAYKLPSEYVIHTVSPVYGQEDGLEDDYLKLCYKNSLRLADDNALESIAFPNLSTGLYRYPKDEASEIALESIHEYFQKNPGSKIKDVYVISFTEKDMAFVNQAIRDLNIDLEQNA